MTVEELKKSENMLYPHLKVRPFKQMAETLGVAESTYKGFFTREKVPPYIAKHVNNLLELSVEERAKILA